MEVLLLQYWKGELKGHWQCPESKLNNMNSRLPLDSIRGGLSWGFACLGSRGLCFRMSFHVWFKVCFTLSTIVTELAFEGPCVIVANSMLAEVSLRIESLATIWVFTAIRTPHFGIHGVIHLVLCDGFQVWELSPAHETSESLLLALMALLLVLYEGISCIKYLSTSATSEMSKWK